MPLKMSRPLLALGALLLLASATGAKALDLGVSVGGANVGVSVGGESGVGVDVGVGGADVSVGVGGGSAGGLGVDLDFDLGGDGEPETSSGGQSIQPLGQEGALKAVQSNRALPLEDILTRARLVAEGEIIDAQLIQVRRILVYEIKVLGKAGDVRELYFYARSGALVAPK
jgi:hypothetical protein